MISHYNMQEKLSPSAFQWDHHRNKGRELDSSFSRETTATGKLLLSAEFFLLFYFLLFFHQGYHWSSMPIQVHGSRWPFFPPFPLDRGWEMEKETEKRRNMAALLHCSWNFSLHVLPCAGLGLKPGVLYTVTGAFYWVNYLPALLSPERTPVSCLFVFAEW